MKISVVGGGPAGLYFSILMKKTKPEYDIGVYEQNQYDDTFGFGVVFSDETLDNFLSHDPETYERIIKEFAYWDEIDFNFKGETIRTKGHGFCGCGRRELLLILQDRCHELGVNFHFKTKITNLNETISVSNFGEGKVLDTVFTASASNLQWAQFRET